MLVRDTDLQLCRPLACSKSTHLVADAWRSLQYEDATKTETYIVTCNLEWISSCRARWNGSARVSSTVPREAWVPPRRPSGPRKRRPGGAPRAPRPSGGARKSGGASKRRKTGDAGGGGPDVADALAECADEEPCDAASEASSDAAADLLDAGPWIPDEEEEAEIFDALVEELDLKGADPEKGPEESAEDAMDESVKSDPGSGADAAEESPEDPAPEGGDGVDPGKADGGGLGAALMPADAESRWSSGLTDSVVALQHRHSVFAAYRERATRCTPLDRKKARARYECFEPVFVSDAPYRALALLEDRHGRVDIWHFVLNDCDNWPCPVLMDMASTSMSSGFGYKVRLDVYNRFIIPGGISDTKASVANLSVVCPDIGCVLSRGPKSERLHRPDWVHLLMRIWQIAHSPLVLASLCNICGAHVDGDSFTCAICLCTYHRKCTHKCSPTDNMLGRYSADMLAGRFGESNMCRFCCTAFGI